MITGTVIDGLIGTIQLRVSSREEQVAEFHAIVDTGFNGDLTLPINLIETLGLVRDGSRKAVLADGSITSADLYLGTTIWNGKPREVQIVAVDGSPLAGMELFRNHLLTMEVTELGAVRIQPLIGR